MHNGNNYSLQVLIDVSDVFDRNFYICNQSEFSLYCSVIYVTSANDQQAVFPNFITLKTCFLPVFENYRSREMALC